MKNTFTASSIFNEDLQVTEELYAVSFAKQSYASLEPGMPTKLAEHALILVQTPQMFYKAEIIIRENEGKEDDYVIKDKQLEFVSERGFKERSQDIFGHKGKKENYLQHTWLVSKDKVEAMLAEIAKDMGSVEMAEKHSIPYFSMGSESLGSAGNFLELVKVFSMLGALHVSGTNLGSVINLRFMHNAHTCTDACNPEISSALTKSAIVALSVVGNDLVQRFLPGKDSFPKMHSCATWAAEKLYNLNMPEISDSLSSSELAQVIDKLAFISTLHMNNEEEIVTALRTVPCFKPIFNGMDGCVRITKGWAEGLGCIKEEEKEIDASIPR